MKRILYRNQYQKHKFNDFFLQSPSFNKKFDTYLGLKNLRSVLSQKECIPDKIA